MFAVSGSIVVLFNVCNREGSPQRALPEAYTDTYMKIDAIGYGLTEWKCARSCEIQGLEGAQMQNRLESSGRSANSIK